MHAAVYSYVLMDVITVVTVLLQNGADASIGNTDSKTPLDLADPEARLILSGMLCA